MQRLVLPIGVLALLAAAAALPGPATPAPEPTPDRFADHWYDGKAEVSRYALRQERYGEMRDGDAVLVFVTEDFRPAQQVKAERAGGARVSVLKLNRLQRFTTGIYDYSLMQSVFTPVDRARYPRTLKTSASVQDWCGHAWLQLNAKDDGYRATGHLYFEAEGEQRFQLSDAVLEDELPNLVRLGTDGLPVGELTVVPGSFFARLQHRPVEPVAARATLDPVGADTLRYAVEMPALGRTVALTFGRALPHRIERIEERDGGRLVLEAVRTHTERTAYWNQNGSADAGLRARLGLSGGG